MNTKINRLVGTVISITIIMSSLSPFFSLNIKAMENEYIPVEDEFIIEMDNSVAASFSSDMSEENNSTDSVGISKELEEWVSGPIDFSATESEDENVTDNTATEEVDVYDQGTVNEETNIYNVVDVEEYTQYVNCDFLNVRVSPDVDGEKIATVKINTQLCVTGTVEGSSFVRVRYNDRDLYVDSTYLQDEEVDIYQIPAPTEELNSTVGTINDAYGFRLTYYNWDMSWCISYMRSLGYTDEVWVDEYGFKRMGKYIMAAGHYKKGTILKCSQGDVIIVDHGSFEETYGKYALDLCTTWD